MWAKLLSCIKYLWSNPIVQLICFSIVEGLYVFLKKITHGKYVRKSVDTSEYTIGTTTDIESVPANADPTNETQSVSVVKPVKPRKTRSKKFKLLSKVIQAKIKQHRINSKRVIIKDTKK